MFIVERAHAQEISTTTDVVESFSMTDFLDVSYSTDGIRWTSVGKVSKNNWKNFSVEIPVHSWAELKRLQVMVSTLPTIDEKPDIYLDSMSVHVDYKQTLSEIASNSLASVTTAVDSLLGNQSGDENFDPFAVKEDAPAEVKIVVPHVPATHTERKLLFSSRGEHTATQVVLPWYDDELKAKMKKQSSQSKDLTIQTTADESSFVVSGTCDHAYYVVLMFRNPKDYINKPNSFVSNSAFPCTNKSFTYDHKVISPEIPEGTYYMLVAGEDETGPWMPMSSIVPITINATTTTVTVE